MDLAEKKETFAELAPGVYALTAEGDPNSGVLIGDDSVPVIDARATPKMAGDLVAQVRRVTDKPPPHPAHALSRSSRARRGGL